MITDHVRSLIFRHHITSHTDNDDHDDDDVINRRQHGLRWVTDPVMRGETAGVQGLATDPTYCEVQQFILIGKCFQFRTYGRLFIKFTNSAVGHLAPDPD